MAILINKEISKFLNDMWNEGFLHGTHWHNQTNLGVRTYRRGKNRCKSCGGVL